MCKIAIIYWSNTGNTRLMAEAIKLGTKIAHQEAACFDVTEFRQSDLNYFNGFILGCPASGHEELDQKYFEPFFSSIEPHLSHVPLALFGSHCWGDGSWMIHWRNRCLKAGAKLFCQSLTAINGPTDQDIKACEALGKAFVSFTEEVVEKVSNQQKIA